MTVSTSQAIRTSPLTDGRIAPDRRRHRRFELALLGRFMRANKQEFPCKLNDISVGGASVASPVEVDIGERIIAYFDEIGGLEGHVVRVYEGGFAMQLSVSMHKRDKLAAHITWLVNKEVVGDAETRRHRRISVANKTSTLKLDEYSSVPCHVLDVSLSGASIGTDARPPIGSEVLFGRMRCRVMRYHTRGIGVQFLDMPDPEALRRYFG